MKTTFKLSAVMMLCLLFCSAAAGQERPLLTEDPRLTPPDVLVVESGLAYGNPVTFTISQLTGKEISLFANGLYFAPGDRVELEATMVAQDLLKPNTGGAWKHDVGDLSISTKVKVFEEGRFKPIVSWWISTTLPNANQGSGLGLNTLRLWSSVLAGKTMGRVFVFGNIGTGILDDSERVAQQEDVLTYGVATYIRLNGRVKLAAEVNGQDNPRPNPTPGSETHGQARLGIRFDAAGFTWDAALTSGFTYVDPRHGFVAGLTKQIHF